MSKVLPIKNLPEKLEIGKKVYVPTAEHGLADAKITKINKDNGKIVSVSVQFIDDFLKETYGSDDIVYMESNIHKLVIPTGSEIVRPTYWMSQNRKEFPDWVNTTFSIFDTCKKRKIESSKVGDISLFNQQEFIRDYMGRTSPFRGLELYNGLGSGKTLSSIAAAENLKDTRNIVIMLPAALKTNFIESGLKKCCYKGSNGNKKIKDKYTFISYNSSNVIKQIDAIGSLDNKVIIVDEAHNLATMIVNGLRGMGKQGAEIYKRLFDAKNSKILLLTGTPVVNVPFEIAVQLNIIRGPIEVIVFVVKRFQEKLIDEYLAEVIKDERIGYVDFNRKNRSLTAILRVNSWDMEFEQTIKFLERTAGKHQATVSFQGTDRYPLFPEDEEEFEGYFVRKDEFINKNMFQRRILGLVSYYQGQSEKDTDFPDLLPEKIIKVQMSSHQFELYELAREKEREKERRAAYQQKVGQKGKDSKVSTLARVFSREFSNFVFPDEIVRPFKAFEFITRAVQEEQEQELKRQIKRGEITANQAKAAREKAKELKKQLSAEKLDTQIRNALDELSNSDKNYLKPGPQGLERYSPKMAAMYQWIQNTKKGLILVYSTFRRVEGLEVFSRVLEANGYIKYHVGMKMDKENDFKRFAFYSGEEDANERKIITNIFRSEENKYGELIRILLVSPAGTEGLDLKNIRLVELMEPYWHEVRNRQVIGRAVRKNSHSTLPKNERNVQVVRFLSVLSPEQRLESKEKLSTDEYVANVAQRKEKLNQAVLEAVREAAVDCTLNKCVNDNKKCFEFVGKKEGLAYMPDISRDLAFGYSQTQVREVTRQLRIGAITEDNEVLYKKSKDGPWYLANGNKYTKPVKLRKKNNKVIFNPETLEAFDYNAFKTSKSMIRAGNIKAEDSKLYINK